MAAPYQYLPMLARPLQLPAARWFTLPNLHWAVWRRPGILQRPHRYHGRWNRPLSTAEITALYNGGAGLNCAGIVNTAISRPHPHPGPNTSCPTEGATVYLVDLPSGSSGSVVMTATAGELLGVTAVAALITINLFIILRDMVMTVGIKRDDT